MSRSIWKGPYVDPSLLKKVEKLKEQSNKPPIKTPYESACPAEGNCGVNIKRERIKLIFKIEGEKDPAANLPCTFMIDVKCATKEIKIK